jgi:PAS domain S-box-containing protein
MKNTISHEEMEQYRVLFEAAPDSVEVVGKRGHILNCNQATEKLYGLAREELRGLHTTFAFAPEFRDLFRKKFPVLREKGEVEGEVEVLTADGRRVRHF